jgi:hypothetical protein
LFRTVLMFFPWKKKLSAWRQRVKLRWINQPRIITFTSWESVSHRIIIPSPYKQILYLW